MKFALFVATLAVVSGIQLSHDHNGVGDESKETTFDTLNGKISNTHKDAEKARTTAVDKQEASDKWRGVKDPSVFGV